MKQFLSCDWGTSSFRLRVVDASTKNILSEVKSNQGIATTHQDWLVTKKGETERVNHFRKVLANAIQNLPTITIDEKTPIILSGMASSSIGIKEIPYGDFPFEWNASKLTIDIIEADQIFPYPILLVSGMKTNRDIMRGEETIMLGCEVDHDESVLILPGTHSKHVYTKNKIGYDFKTYMTGELFNLLTQSSILSNSVIKGTCVSAFESGLKESSSESILHSMFTVRAKHLLNHTPSEENYQYLSGLLVGEELRNIPNDCQSIYLISENPLLQQYEHAIKLLHSDKKIICKSSIEAIISGHYAIYRSYF